MAYTSRFGRLRPGAPAQCRLAEVLPVFFTVFDLFGEELGDALPLLGRGGAAALPQPPDQPDSRFGEAEGGAEIPIQRQGQEVAVHQVEGDAAKLCLLLGAGGWQQEAGGLGFGLGEQGFPFVRKALQPLGCLQQGGTVRPG